MVPRQSRSDALRHLVLLPCRTKLVIADSHDVTGGNNDGFTSAYSYQYRTPEGWVLFGTHQSGTVQLIRTIGFRTALKVFRGDSGEPDLVIPFAEIYSGTHPDFPLPYVGEEESAHGSSWCFVPIPFENGCRIVAPEKEESYHFFNVWAHIYTEDTPEWEKAADRVLWSSEDETAAASPACSGAGSLDAHGRQVLFEQSTPGLVTSIRVRLPEERRSEVLRDVHLRAFWDGREAPDVDAPLGLFFGVGYPDDEALRRTPSYPLGEGEKSVEIPTGRISPCALPVSEEPDGTLVCRFPMPFDSARIELVNTSAHSAGPIAWQLSVEPLPEAEPGRKRSRFRAIYRREHGTLPHRDYTVAEVRGHGRYVGCVMRMSSRGLDHGLRTVQRLFLEGDARFYVDDAKSFLCGSTGTEEYFNWGWYDMPPKDEVFAYPTHGYTEHTRDSEDHSTMYRFHVTDSMPYYRSLRFDIEHGPEGEIVADYESVAFFYHSDECALTLCDTVPVGSTAHDYRSDGVVAREALIRVYEGNDQVLARKADGWLDVAGISDSVEAISGTAGFAVAVPPENTGLRIRRRYDGAWREESATKEPHGSSVVGEQAARVTVDGEDAGVWHLPPRHARECWMEDEFEVPSRLTRGKARVRVALESVGEVPWNAARYWVYAYVG